MVNKLVFLAALGLLLVGCSGEEVVKAGVPPPSANDGNAPGRKNATVPKAPVSRGGLDLPKQLPKGPY